MPIEHAEHAICDGCGIRELVTDGQYPHRWPALIDADGAHRYCSQVCLHDNYGTPPKHWPLGLTDHEVDLLTLMAQGLSNKEIGLTTHRELAKSTVKNTLSRVYAKLLGKRSPVQMNRVEAVLRGHQLGIINLNLAAQQSADRLRAAA